MLFLISRMENRMDDGTVKYLKVKKIKKEVNFCLCCVIKKKNSKEDI